MSLNYLSVTERRARAILETYGSAPASWPEDARQLTLECIAHSPVLQRYQAQIADLDRRIQSAQAAALPSTTEVLALQQRILATLPAQTRPQANARTQRIRKSIIDWLLTPRFALALTGLAVLAIVVLWPQPLPPVLQPQASSQYEAWSWYDITGQELSVANSNTSLTMTDWIDLETNEDGS